jgi:NAD(P)H-flavin reductase
MANAPGEPGLEFHLRVLSGGVSGLVRDRLEVGDLVRISGPFGTSYLRAQHPGPILAIAGGTGLAPIRSIVAAALAAGVPGPIHVYFGVREERDVYGEQELREWQARYPNLRVHVVLSEHTGADNGRRAGMVTDAVRADFDSLAGFHAYLAGPPAMVDAASEILREKGVGARDMHADAFYSAAPPAHKAAAA